MRKSVILLSIILTFFATGVLAYISIATMLGPWIAPILVLVASSMFKLARSKQSSEQTTTNLVLIQTVGSVGGAAATAAGFTLPTLFFLDKVQFQSWMDTPISFCSFIAVTCLAAGSFGIWLARAFADKLIIKEKLSFPVSHLIHKTITSQTQSNQARNMFSGFFGTAFFCFLRDGFQLGSLHLRNLIPTKNIFVLQSLLGKEFHIVIMPMLWAVGFIAGIKIAFPLLVGMISRYLVLTPLNLHSLYLPFRLFPVLDKQTLTMAFCSGMILSEVIPGLLKYPGIMWDSIKNFSGYDYLTHLRSFRDIFNNSLVSKIKNIFKPKNSPNSSPIDRFLTSLEALFAFGLSIALFTYFQFPILAQLFILTLTVMATYQISMLSGKIGLVPYGRFVTFVMIPTMLLFKLSFFQITLLCLFVGICSAVATDLLFDYKIAELCNISFQRIHRFQWLGLLATAAGLGFFFWLLITNLHLGTTELFGQRGLTRSLMIQSLNFDLTVVFLGFLFGYILKKIKISPSMAFGGILMPNNLTIGLVIGAIGSTLVKDKMEHFPMASGIFAGETMWLIVSILAKMI